MLKVSAWIVITCAVAYLLMMASTLPGDFRWNFAKSPDTGICYETKTLALPFSVSQAMSPVDPSYCAENE